MEYSLENVPTALLVDKVAYDQQTFPSISSATLKKTSKKHFFDQFHCNARSYSHSLSTRVTRPFQLWNKRFSTCTVYHFSARDRWKVAASTITKHSDNCRYYFAEVASEDFNVLETGEQLRRTPDVGPPGWQAALKFLNNRTNCTEGEPAPDFVPGR